MEKKNRTGLPIFWDKGYCRYGCYRPTQWNTKALEEAGWTGLMFDIREKWVKLCSQARTSKVFCVDVSTDEFANILNDNLDTKFVDYISLDADDGVLEPCSN